MESEERVKAFVERPLVSDGRSLGLDEAFPTTRDGLTTSSRSSSEVDATFNAKDLREIWLSPNRRGGSRRPSSREIL